MYNQRKEDKCHRIAAFGGETGAGSVEGRGLFAGATLAGVHAEVSERDGRSLGFQEQLYYKLKNLGKKQKYVGLSIPTLGIFGDYFMYDHANRNDNQTNFKDKEQFEKEALDKNLDVGPYPAWASKFHNPENRQGAVGRGLRCTSCGGLWAASWAPFARWGTKGQVAGVQLSKTVVPSARLNSFSKEVNLT